MDSTIRFIQQHWSALLLPLTVVGVTILTGFVARNLVFRLLRRWTGGTESRFDDIFVEALYSPFMIWVLMLALHLGTQTSTLPARAQNIAAQIFLVLFSVSMTVVF